MNKSELLSVLVCVFLLTVFFTTTTSSETYELADLNNDGVVNVFDMIVYLEITAPGDTNDDYVIDIYDLAGVGKAFYSREGDADYDPGADVNMDKFINVIDLASVGRNYGMKAFETGSSKNTSYITVEPHHTEVIEGGNFTIDVDIDTDDEVFASSLYLFFDPDILEVTDAEEGNFLKKDGNATFPQIRINNTDGYVDFGNTRFGLNISGVSGSGTLVSVNFTAKSTGTSGLELVNVTLLDRNLLELPSVYKTDGDVDVVEMRTNGETRPCPLQEGVCEGSYETCTNGSWPGCNESSYGPDYEDTETTCDGLDNDCDNQTDEGGDSLCDDGLWCNGEETCGGANGCQAGTAVDCSDNLFCTVNERCDEVSDACVYDDRDCSSNDVSGIATCDNNPDSNPYTWDYREAFTSICDEIEDVCTQGEIGITHTCNKVQCGAECEQNSDCDDSDPYTVDTCLGDCTCDHEVLECLNDGDCDHLDSDYCEGDLLRHDEGYCDNGSCLTNTTTAQDCHYAYSYCYENDIWVETGFCNANTAQCGCTQDISLDCGYLDKDYCSGSFVVNEYGQCVDVPQTMCITAGGGYDCNNQNWCDGEETCSEEGGVHCENGSAPDCDDSVGCTDDSCDEVNDQCVNTVNDANCDDGVGCTDDTCDAVLDCQFSPNDANCDDGLWCNGFETCDALLDCQAGTPVDCSYLDDQCNDGYCNEVNDQCEKDSTPYEDLSCNDGLYCNVGETCQSGDCTGGQARDCSDGVGCTDDSCDEANDVCVNDANDANCDDGLWCNGEETCGGANGCQAGTVVDCSDNLFCTVNERCDEVSDACVYDDRDCSSNDVSWIATCDNNPDSNPYTWDYREAFTSICDEIEDVCTQGEIGITHTCNKVQCGAECESDGECAETDCDNLDGCYSGTYRDYDDVANDCSGDCTCEGNSCTVYSEIITDLDNDGYDTECDDDCDDNNASIHPGAAEVCNGVDDDCDGIVDEDCIILDMEVATLKDSYSVNEKIELTDPPESLDIQDDFFEVSQEPREITKEEEDLMARFLAGNKSVSEYDIVEVTRWSGPEGTRPLYYSETKQPSPTFTTKLVSPSRKIGVATGSTVYVLVESGIYTALEDYISRYQTDLENEGYAVEVYSGTYGNPEDVKSFLQQGLPNLKGAVFIGDIPAAWYENENDYGGRAEFPLDLFYMDLDGTWTDSDQDGMYDGHTGEVETDIWIGRIDTTHLSGNKIEMYRNYFDKNHAYREGNSVLPLRSLNYVDDDWYNLANTWNENLGLLYEYRTSVKDEEGTNGVDYKNRLKWDYEWISVYAHSWPGGHSFRSSTHETVYSSDIEQIDPHGLFYNLFACSAAHFLTNDFVAGKYLFADTYGLVVVGSTKTGSMLWFDKFYEPLGEGKNLGESFKDWFNYIAYGGFQPNEIIWHYGMVLLGDPTLKPNQPNQLPVSHLNEIDYKTVSDEVIFEGSSKKGEAAGSSFQNYDLSVGSGINPSEWSSRGVSLLNDGLIEVDKDVVGDLDTTLSNERFCTVKLTVHSQDGKKTDYRVVLNIDNINTLFPEEGSFIRSGDVISLVGTIKGTNLESYTVEYGEGKTPSVWHSDGITLSDGQNEVVDDVFALWDTSLIDTNQYYTLRITRNDNDGSQATEYVTFVLDPDYKEGWPQKVDYRLIAPAVGAGDLDGDGTMEIVAGETQISDYSGKRVYVWHADGSYMDGWPKDDVTSSKIRSSPALADIDFDGDLEIFIGTGYKLYGWHHNGDDITNWPQYVSDEAYTGPAIADIDNDGSLEIVAVAFDLVYVWKSNGDLLSGWPKQLPEYTASYPALGDLDGDGYLEIVLKADKIYAWNHDGTDVSGWPVELGGYRTDSSPVLADIDNDGKSEVIVNKDKVYVIDDDGVILKEFNAESDWIDSTPALGDIDNDGEIEIIVSSYGKLFAFNLDGTQVSGWPVENVPCSMNSPVIGDIDGDNNLEILLATNNYNDKFYAFNNDGTPVEGWPKLVPIWIPKGWHSVKMNAPVLEDIDNDGFVEIILGDENYLFVWDLNGAYNKEKLPWNQFNHDNTRTGNYKLKRRPQSKIVNSGNFEVSGSLNIKIEKMSNEIWDEYLNVVSDLPVTVPANGLVKLDQIFNPLDVAVGEAGEYRVYAGFEAEGEEITANYEFSVCEDECPTSGAKQCSGNILEECRTNWDIDGCLEWGTIEDCAASGKICQDGVCVECVDEICDGIDNDCDGQIDEDWPELNTSCSVGTGECYATGNYVCKADGSGTECNAVPGQPSTETCDGLDNDCDGSIDEGMTAPLNSNQQGVCQGSTKTCTGSGGWVDDYSNVAEYEDPEVSYDGKDNDCDGLTDALDPDCPAPDLTVVSALVYPENSVAGEYLIVEVTLQNIGEVASDNVYWEIDTGSADPNPKNSEPMSLNVNQKAMFNVGFKYAEKGTYIASVIADPDDVVDENNEGNNVLHINVTVINPDRETEDPEDPTPDHEDPIEV